MKKTPLALFLACGLILTGGAAAAASLVLHTPNATYRVLTDHQTRMDENEQMEANDEQDGQDGEHDGEDAD